MLSETQDVRKTPVRLIHHAANCDHGSQSGSLSALDHCLAAGAALVEIDILSLADGSFALLHDRGLSSQTSGEGDAIQSTRKDLQSLTYKSSKEKIGFLEDAVEIFKRFPQALRLQLDLKPYTPLTRAILRDFTEALAPVIDRIQVTSVADWAVRSLPQFAPELALGFDPLLYLDIPDEDPRPTGILPFRLGAYGLLDDHPLSTYQWGSMGEYFAARASALLVQAPHCCEWYFRAEVLEMALKAGFDWIEFLHQYGTTVDAWTFDATKPHQVRLAQFLIEHGIDELTTDTPARLAERLTSVAIF